MVEGAVLGAVRCGEQVTRLLTTVAPMWSKCIPTYLPLSAIGNALRSGTDLSTCPLRAVAVLLERFDDPLAMVALHFDHAVLDRSTRAACRA
jgi:hypothetical protein